MTRNTALVAGVGGIIGNAVTHELMRSDWRVRALGLFRRKTGSWAGDTRVRALV
jgi:hypothetical protein